MVKKREIVPKEPKKKTSVMLSDTTQMLREWLASELGINQTAVIELAVRELAMKWGYYKND